MWGFHVSTGPSLATQLRVIRNCNFEKKIGLFAISVKSFFIGVRLRVLSTYEAILATPIPKS